MRWFPRTGRCWRPGPPSVTLALLLSVGGLEAQPAPPDPTAATRTALLDADDARVQSDVHRRVVMSGLAHDDPDVRVMALRAMARTQRAEFFDGAAAAFGDASIDVRREAAFAVAHIASGTATALPGARAAFEAALMRERDTLVLSALAEEYGRLPLPDVDAIEAAASLLRRTLVRVSESAAISPLYEASVARGAEALARRAVRLKAHTPTLRELLRTLADTGSPAAAGATTATPMTVRARRLAMAGLLALSQADDPAVDAALRAPDAQVRRLGVIALARRAAVPTDLLATLMRDDAVIVRHAVAARLGPAHASVAEVAAADPHVSVRVAALTALGQAHACRTPCTARLGASAAFGPRWQEGAAALLALASTDPPLAKPHVVRAARADTWQVRMYAARAAALTKQREVLEALAADGHVNVRHAALSAWRGTDVTGWTGAAVRALESDDGQLVLEAATALQHVPASPGLRTALRTALERLTAGRRETSRDPRMALLERLAAVEPTPTDTLRPYLTDFDPVVAERAATLVNARLPAGAPRVRATPLPLPRIAVPTWEDVAALDGSSVTFRLSGHRLLRVRLFARQAPTAVARFVAQVRAGEWDGRTFHRVEPGFVVQGGSPAANEYAGAGAFTRDEFSPLSHVRGTVGISTRGADTGDGQIFVNLVDNVRLDYGFTLIGSISGDLAPIDDIVEGEVIERATWDGPR